jgi:hypothetical protein
MHNKNMSYRPDIDGLRAIATPTCDRTYIKIIKFVVCAFSLSISGAAWSTSGRDLAKWIPDFESYNDTFGGGAFIGYVSGVADLGRGSLFCPPKDATNGHLAAIVVTYLKNHPEKLHEIGSNLVVEALRQAFPQCPAP